MAPKRLLQAIAEVYADNPRIVALGVLGSVARGTADEWSDLDLDATTIDGAPVDAVAEVSHLCTRLGYADALFVPSRSDEVDVVLPTLERFSIRYHPIGTLNAHVVDDLKIVRGRMNKADIVAAGVRHTRPPRHAEQVASEALCLAVNVDVAVRRGNVWQGLRLLDELRWHLEELFATTHGLVRPAHAIDTHADHDLRTKLSGTIAEAEVGSIRRALRHALALLCDDALTSGSYALSGPQRTVLTALSARL